MDESLCCVPNCDNEKRTRNMCSKHYTRWRKYKDVNHNGRLSNRDPIDWLLSNYKTNESGCWIWTALSNNTGYGVVRFRHERKLAHRVSYRHFYGDFDETLCVLHKCDNRMCINPDHLFLGTRFDNNLDKEVKGRGLKGEQIPVSKLTDAVVKAARGSNLSITELANKYGVSHETMRKALNGTTWRHV